MKDKEPGNDTAVHLGGGNIAGDGAHEAEDGRERCEKDDESETWDDGGNNGIYDWYALNKIDQGVGRKEGLKGADWDHEECHKKEESDPHERNTHSTLPMPQPEIKKKEEEGECSEGMKAISDAVNMFLVLYICKSSEKYELLNLP